MLDPQSLKSAIATLQAGSASSVQPLASDLATQFQTAVATQKKIDQATQLSSDMSAVSADLAPVAADLEARRARNSTLKARLAELQTPRSTP